jgi:hypothetical protein
MTDSIIDTIAMLCEFRNVEPSLDQLLSSLLITEKHKAKLIAILLMDPTVCESNFIDFGVENDLTG